MSHAPLSLLVLAAGMGSRFGGLKQLEPVGPNGEIILDYSVHDALRAGFQRIVFVIRREFADVFNARIGSRYGESVHVDYAFQDLHDLPPGHRVPQGREKPWGTLHAVLSAREIIDGPFGVINADDFYGRDAYQRVAGFLARDSAGGGPEHYCLAGYPVSQTLSPNGGVNRGICRESAGGLLDGVEELIDIRAGNDGVCRGTRLSGERVEVAPHAMASMNFWGFTPAVFAPMEVFFSDFLRDMTDPRRAECYIPSLVDHLVRRRKADCRVLPTASAWFGMTYPEDKPVCIESLRQLIAAGVYAEKLGA